MQAYPCTESIQVCMHMHKICIMHGYVFQGACLEAEADRTETTVMTSDATAPMFSVVTPVHICHLVDVYTCVRKFVQACTHVCACARSAAWSWNPTHSGAHQDFAVRDLAGRARL
jgi:hypothetical protein